MNFDKYIITPELLKDIIQKEHDSIRFFEELDRLVQAGHKDIISGILKDEREIYSLLVKLYESLSSSGSNIDLLKPMYRFDDLERALTTGIVSELELYSHYNYIINSENSPLFKIYFSDMMHYKNKHAVLLNLIYSDCRGCNCHKEDHNRKDSCCCSRIAKPGEKHDKDLLDKYWEQHVWWTRSLVISIIDELKDTDEVTKRLLRNPIDISSLFKAKYGEDVAKAVQDLLTEHLVIGKKLILAVKNDDKASVADLDAKWYRNADNIAKALESINPKAYDKETWRKLLYAHLDMTKKEVGYRLMRHYVQDIRNFDDIETEALVMSKEMLKGL